jgi:hypothetical protein
MCTQVLREMEMVDIPGMDQMRDCKDATKNDAEPTNNDVCNTQKGIPATHDSLGRYDDGLGACIFRGREV